jgi:hypothetical protein
MCFFTGWFSSELLNASTWSEVFTSCRVSLRYGCTTGSPNGVVHFTVCPADAIICVCHSRNFNIQKSYNERKRKTKNFMHSIQKLLSLRTLKKRQRRRNEID